MDVKRRRNEMEALEQERQWAASRASRLAGSLPFLVEQYTSRFPRFFQEVYDPQMAVEIGSIYDDRPAGFRLLYKHGRAATTQWTLIHTLDEFIDALCNFFVLTESEIAREPQMEGLERDLSDLIRSIIHHLRTDIFLESAFYRMAKIHKTVPVENPLQNLDKVEKKPWAYISGGGMRESSPPTTGGIGSRCERGRYGIQRIYSSSSGCDEGAARLNYRALSGRSHPHHADPVPHALPSAFSRSCPLSRWLARHW
jgi:hypothetical protein